MKIVRLLIGLNKLLCRLEGFLLATTLITMLVFSALQVILRNVFDSGIEWGDVFARNLVLWVGFFGATLATQEGQHIRIDALAKALGKKWQPLIEFVVLSFCIVVSYLLFNAAYKFAMDERMAATVLFEGIPTWYFIAIMPLGFAIITFRYTVHLIELLFTFGGKGKLLDEAEDCNGIDISVNIKVK